MKIHRFQKEDLLQFEEILGKEITGSYEGFFISSTTVVSPK